MGTRVDEAIAAFQEATGIRPASGREAGLLRAMSDKAFELIKLVELELSGIRDGDGGWHGSDVMGGTTGDLVELIKAYRQASVGVREQTGSNMFDDVFDDVFS